MIVQFDTTFTLYVCWIHFAILYYISVNACFGLFMDVNLYDYPIISQNETYGIDFYGKINLNYSRRQQLKYKCLLSVA